MSSSSTSNNLTDEQELITREFFEKVVEADNLWISNTASQRQLAGAIVRLMGYSYTAKGLRPIDQQVTFKYGETPTEDNSLYDADGELVRAAYYGTTTDNSSD